MDLPQHEDNKHVGEPPLDYTDDLPTSTGSAVDKFFWWGTRTVLPDWLDPTSKFSTWFLDQIFIDCAYCLAMRGLVIGGILGIATGLIVGLLI